MATARLSSALRPRPRAFAPQIPQIRQMQPQFLPTRQIPRRTGPYLAHNDDRVRRAFHSTRSVREGHHFDTLKFVERLQKEGFTEQQAAGMMKILNDVLDESFKELEQTMVSRDDANKASYQQKVDFASLRSELGSADSTETNTTRATFDRLSNDITKLNARLRDEISRTLASVRLDLNLEKGRIREEALGLEIKLKETEAKIEQEAALLKEKLDQVKFQSLQWLVGVCTGFAALLLGAWRLFM